MTRCMMTDHYCLLKIYMVLLERDLMRVMIGILVDVEGFE